MADWRPLTQPTAITTWCTWCGQQLRGQMAIDWRPYGPDGHSFLGCWRCTILRAAHRMVTWVVADGDLQRTFFDNPDHVHCPREAAA